MEAEKNLHEIASSSIDIIGGRRSIVFSSSVKHAETLAEIFNRHRAGMAAWVCGKTPKDDRRKILADFAAGKIQVVANCGVLTEGFDDPGVEVIVMGRPTKSRSLYSQMVGRSTRPLPGVVDGPEDAEGRRAAIAGSSKPSCLVVDFVGNSGRHKLITSADILGGKVSDEVLERAIAKARKAGKPVRMDEAIAEEEELMRAEQEERRLAEQARKARLVANAKFSTHSVDPFDVFQVQPARARGWDSGRTLSEKQRSLLTKQGIDPDSLPYAQAKQIIGEIISRWDKNLCSFKQAKILKRYGYDVNVTFEEASKRIDALKNNNWQKVRPPVPQLVAAESENPF
jgi:type I site-specific restriction endonuclease